jgi:hypothetical protein
MCLDSGVPLRKFKILVKTKFVSCVIVFQETLEFRNKITLCYGRQLSLALESCAKPLGLGRSSSCCRYFGSYCLVVCVELK